MSNLNKYIYVVMKWLDDPNSVSKEELEENRNSAYAAAVVAAVAAVAAVASYAYAAADAADAADADAEIWVNRYFERSGENKKNYLDKIKADKMESEEKIYTQAMFDAGELPKIGMMVKVSDKHGHLLHDIKNNDLVECICHSIDSNSNNIGVYRHSSGVSVSINLDYIKPIDTRTDKEKAIDDFVSLLDELGYETIMDIDGLVNSIQAGKIHGITFTGDK